MTAGGRQGGETGTDDKWGPVVAIEDASGRVWRVCGTTDAKVKKGDTVSAGQTIGKVGSVSCECAEESHIHLEVMEGEKVSRPHQGHEISKIFRAGAAERCTCFFSHCFWRSILV